MWYTPHVKERPAPGVAFLHKRGGAIPVHVGPPHTPKARGASVIDLAQLTIRDKLAGCPCFWCEIQAVLYAQLEICGLGGLQHGLCIHPTAGHWLFAEHMLPVLQRSHGGGHVQVVVQAYIHGRKVIAGEHCAKVRRPGGHSILIGHPVQLGPVDVREGYQFHIGLVCIMRDMAFADLAAADYPHSDGIGLS